MITLSPRAASQVRTMQNELNAPAKRLRVFVESGGCSGFQYGMSFDEPKSGDTQFESEGVAVIMDAEPRVFERLIRRFRRRPAGEGV